MIENQIRCTVEHALMLVVFHLNLLVTSGLKLKGKKLDLEEKDCIH